MHGECHSWLWVGLTLPRASRDASRGHFVVSSALFALRTAGIASRFPLDHPTSPGAEWFDSAALISVGHYPAHNVPRTLSRAHCPAHTVPRA